MVLSSRPCTLVYNNDKQRKDSVNINFENMCQIFYGDMLTTPDEAADLEFLLGEEADRQAKAIKEDDLDAA